MIYKLSKDEIEEALYNYINEVHDVRKSTMYTFGLDQFEVEFNTNDKD